jgi:hypothetical protein
LLTTSLTPLTLIPVVMLTSREGFKTPTEGQELRFPDTYRRSRVKVSRHLPKVMGHGFQTPTQGQGSRFPDTYPRSWFSPMSDHYICPGFTPAINVVVAIKLKKYWKRGVRIMVFNATFNNISVISWWSVLLVEETGVPRENLSQVTDKLYQIILYGVH